AATNNGFGIAGVDPLARIMPLKVLNFIGRGRSSHIAAAIYYAIDNGARVINLSLGGERLSAVEERALRKAHAAGLVTVIAAGNEGREIKDSLLSEIPSVLVVAASDTENHRARFSNWGRAISVTAPGVDILSLRARDTDLIRFSGAANYKDGAASVGEQFYRASGTSFAAAYVSGVASWLLSHRPTLNGTQVARIISQSARDIEAPGVDALTGYGLVDAQAALAWDADVWLEARIDAVDLSMRDGATRVCVLGTADADQFVNAHLRAAPERYPNDWIELTTPVTKSIRNNVLAEFDPWLLRGSRRWILQLVVSHANGKQREARFIADLGSAP
ncbi:MAG TPA: S8 family serine peptidase, partial [Steroidobacteraceae bacterium]|nr:S8 family serine peptidase [Steroidobacteraceae bacterium]